MDLEEEYDDFDHSSEQSEDDDDDTTQLQPSKKRKVIFFPMMIEHLNIIMNVHFRSVLLNEKSTHSCIVKYGKKIKHLKLGLPL